MSPQFPFLVHEAAAANSFTDFLICLLAPLPQVVQNRALDSDHTNYVPTIFTKRDIQRFKNIFNPKDPLPTSLVLL